jgi:hypothetical protein
LRRRLACVSDPAIRQKPGHCAAGGRWHAGYASEMKMGYNQILPRAKPGSKKSVSLPARWRTTGRRQRRAGIEPGEQVRLGKAGGTLRLTARRRSPCAASSPWFIMGHLPQQPCVRRARLPDEIIRRHSRPQRGAEHRSLRRRVAGGAWR